MSIEGAIIYERDQTLTYNENCQLYLCLLVKFSNSADIVPDRLKLSMKLLQNPISVNPAKDITITTLMKYTADT